jgi:hypothetical protein
MYHISIIPNILQIGVIQQQITSISLTKAGLLIHDLKQKEEQSALEPLW